MIFSLPIVGQVAGALLASDAASSPASVQNTIQQKLQAGGDDLVNAASFTQALNTVTQAPASQPPLSTAKL